MYKSFITKAVSICLIFGLILSCANEIEKSPQNQEVKQDDLHWVTFHAGWVTETKTELQEDGSVWWTPGDEIALFGLNSGKVFRLQSNCEEPSPETDFVGMIDEGDDTYQAIYPYENARGSRNFTIPTTQYSIVGGFSPGQISSYGIADGQTLTFYNLCTGIKFSVAHEGISKIVFKNREDFSPITGNMRLPFLGLDFLNYGDVQPDYDSYDSANPKESVISNTLTVYPAEGDYFIPGKYYYASIRPSEQTYSFVISFYTDNQVATTSLPFKSDIKRSRIITLIEKDKNLVFSDSNNYTYAGLADNYSDEGIVPDGIDKTSIQEVVFHTSSDVTTDTIVPGCVPYRGDPNFQIDYIPVYFKLEGTTAHYYTKADRYMMIGPRCISFKGWSDLRSVDLSMFCTNQVTDFGSMFWGCHRLESVDLSSFDTSNALSFSSMFQSCKSLKKLDISNFSSLNVQDVACMFNSCYDLTQLDLGTMDLSGCETSHITQKLSKFSKNCAVRCTQATRAKLSDYDSRLGSNVNYITWVLPEEELPELEPIVDPNIYTSTDYSKDKTVRILHKATKGNGVDVVLLGDAYSDRMIADGTYDADMELAMDAILKDEPYASFKDYINVYTVYAVSQNEIPYETHTVFDASINYYDPDNGVLSYREASEVYKYASVAFPDKDLKDVAMILIINQAEGEGDAWTDGVAWNETSYVEWEDDAGNYHSDGDLRAIGMINRRDRSQTELFSQIVAHEFGHVFAGLADEYHLYNEDISEREKNLYSAMYRVFGWWSNVDYTSDPQTIRWKNFLEDERYSGTGIGIYLGGHGYVSGAWHSSDDSIMNITDDGTQKMFNAPSREAIYKRIHKLAFGEDWQYDYETFVEYDQKNIALEKAAQSSSEPSPSQSSVKQKHLFKMEESVAPNGRKRVSIVMN